MAQKKELMTQEGYDALLEKREQLLKEQQQNIIDIQDARSQGDLSENADYAAARERQAELASQLNEVEYLIKNAEIISDADNKDNIGKIVTVRFLKTEKLPEEVSTYKLVGSSESDPLNGLISVECPLGKAIRYSKVGAKILVKTDDDRFDVVIEKIEKDKTKK